MKSVSAKNKNSRAAPRRSTTSPQDITAVVLTRNEERNVAGVVESLPSAMQVLVLDHESTDATAARAAACGARVIVRPFAGFVEARRFALSQVRTPWTLMIDADERLDDRLRASILAVPGSIDGYLVSRRTFYCGKPLRMWNNERLLRLFRTDAAQLEAAPAAGGQAQLHERWTCSGTVRALEGVLEHYSYPDAASYRRKYAMYTDIEAQGLRGDPRAAFRQTLLVPIRLLHLLTVRGAVLDGPAGWLLAWYSALYPAVVQWKAVRS